MRTLLRVIVATTLLMVVTGSSRAVNSDAKSIVDKAITAVAVPKSFAKVEAFSVKMKGTVNFNGNETDITTEITFKGLDHYRREFGSDQFHGVIVLAGDKGWPSGATTPARLKATPLPTEKRNVYLAIIPITLVPLKSNGFK